MDRRLLYTIVPLVLLGIGIWGIVEEIQYRSDAAHTYATIKNWQSTRLGGFRGIAHADIDAHGVGAFHKDRSIRTSLWYRPRVGERIPVHYQLGSTSGRVDSLWQGFGLTALLVLIAVGWLVELWWPRRQKEATQQASALGGAVRP